MSLLIKHALLNGKNTDLFIANGIFEKIAPAIGNAADTVIDAEGKAVLPAFYNLHTHAAMSLLKGVADDKELFSWLSQDIWPKEAKLTAQDIYNGTKLATLEMIKSGTAAFSDMYFEQEAIMRAVDESGLRAAVSFVEMDLFDDKQTQTKIAGTQAFVEMPNPNPARIQKALSVHAVYSTSETLMNIAAKTARENNWLIHIHVSETQKEVDDCLEKYGCTPLALLDKHGLIGKKSVLAHAVYLTPEDMATVAARGAFLCTNPASNMKLASGLFPFKRCSGAGCRIVLGTDGSASSNSLSMIEAMKLCALASKIESNDPTAASAHQVFTAATQTGAEAMGLNAGVIEQGKAADCLLVDLNTPVAVPNHNIISNMVYATDSSCIDTLIVAGKILMTNRKVKDENEIIDNALETAERLARG